MRIDKVLSESFLLKNNIFKIFAIVFCAFAYPSFASAQNTLSVKSITTTSNKPISLEIQLNNKDSITAVQFDLSFTINGVMLPETVDSLVRTNRSIDHSPQLSVVGNNTIRVILFNFSNKNIKDTSGTVLNIKALSGALPGTYNPLITNVTLANANGQSLNSNVVTSEITIRAPKISVNTPINLGRIPLLKNYNNGIYVQNIGNENLVIKNITSNSNRLTVNSSFPTLPYSVSNNNGINFNYTLLPNTKGVQADTLTISSNDPGLDSVKKVALNFTAYPVNAILLNNQYVGTYNTALSIPISINNYDTLAGFQFTLRLPDGIKYIDNSISLNAQRISDHLITANQTGNDLTIIAYSPTNSPFKKDTGEVLTLQVFLNKEGGTYNTTMFGCVLSDLKGNNVISDSSSTQIVVRSPQLQVNTGQMDFGRITTKQSSSYNLSLSNNGTDTLVINQLFIPFSAITTNVVLPIKIAPTSSANFLFNFASAKPINIDSSIVIRSNDPLGDKKVLVKAISFSKNEITAPIVAGFHNANIRVPLLITNYDTLQGLQFDVTISDISSLRFTDSSFRISEKYKNLNYSTQILDSSNLRVLIFSLAGNKILPDSNWLGEIRLQSKKGEVQGNFGTMIFQNGIISNNSNTNVASGFTGTGLNICDIVKPSISFSPSSVICDTSVLVSSSIGSIYTLYKNDTIQPFNSVRANVAANWSAIVSNNGCFYISNIQSTTKANQPPAPTINFIGDSTVCKGQSVILYSSSKSNNQWFRNNLLINGATDTALLINSSGLYSVSYNSGGCNSPISRPQTITINDSIPKPIVQNISYCIGSPTTPLTATALPNNTLRWYLTNNISDTARTTAPVPSTSRVDTTTYYVSQVGAGGCESDRAAIRVTVTAKLPTPTVQNLTLCLGSTALPLTATALPGNTLRWYLTNNISDTARTTAPIPSTSRVDTTTYYVSQVGSGGCESDRALIRVIVTAKLPPPTVQNLTLCIGSPTSPLTATALLGNSLRWYRTNQPSDTALGVVPVPSTSRVDTTTYYVSQVGSGGCESDRALIRVIVTAKLPPPTVQNLTLCIGSPTSPLNATALPGNSLRWYRSNQPSDTALSTAPIPSTSRVDTTTYYVTQVGAGGCESDRAAIRVNVTAKLPTPTVQNLTLCIGSTAAPLTAIALPGNTLRWYLTNNISDTARTKAPVPSTSRVDTTTYYVSQVGAGGCESDRVAIRVTVTAKLPTPTAQNLTLCVGSTASPLTATPLPGNILRWYLTNNISDTAMTTAPIPSTSRVDSTTYYVSQVGSGGCESDRAAIRVTVTSKIPTPTVQNLTLCVGSTASPLTATALPGNILRWYLTNNISDTARTTAPIPSTSRVDSTTYYVSQVGSSGCESDRAAIRVTVTAKLPTPTVQNLTLCLGSTAVPLTATALQGNSLRWYRSNQPSDTALSTAPIPSTSRVDTTNYYVSQVSAGGCESDRAEIRVTVVTKLPPPIVSNLSICLGANASPLTAIALNGSNLRWYRTNIVNDTASLIPPTPSSSSEGVTIYYVSQINAGGCESDRAAISVTVTPKAPQPSVNNLVLCFGSPTSPLTATPSAGNILRWYRSNDLNDTASLIAPTPSSIKTDSTFYYVSQFSNGKCESDRAIIIVTVTAKLPPPSVSNVALCIGAPTNVLTATASSGNSLRWYGTSATGDTARLTAPTPSSAFAGVTNYYVSQITNGGCESDRAMITVTVFAKLPPPTVSNISICLGSPTSPLTATAIGGSNLRWYGTNASGGVASVTAPTPSSSAAGTTNYYVSQITAAGCESERALISVTVFTKLPTPLVSNVALCLGSTTAQLTATPLSGNSLRWYRTNSLNDTALINTPTPSSTTMGTTNYYVSQISSFGCESDRAEVAVTVTSKLPPPIIVRDIFLCLNSPSAPLSAITSVGSSLRWYKTNAINDTASTIAPTPSTAILGTTNYYVSQISTNGCESDRAMITATIVALPTTPNITTNSPTTFCNTGSVVLTSSSLNNNQWFKNDTLIIGATNQSFTATQAGAYSVTVTNAAGCKSVSTKTTVSVNPIPTKPTITKSGVDLISSSKVGNIWIREASIITGANDSIYRPLVSGNYRVQVRLNGCSGPTSEPYFYLVTSVVNTNTSADNYKLFPNPVSDKILIDAGTSIHKISFQIFDANGRRMMLNTFTKSTMVDLSKLNSGTYTILITNTKTSKQESKQIIKQ